MRELVATLAVSTKPLIEDLVLILTTLRYVKTLLQ